MFFKYIAASDLFLLKIFNHTIKCKPLDLIMPVFTYLGSLTFTILFCLSTFIYPNKNIRELGINASLTIILSTLIAQVIKTSVSRIRPFIKMPNLNIKKIGIDKYSFPSGHTTAAFSIAVSVALMYPGISSICISLATLVGISRMYLGVHYPSDVIVGILIGTPCSLLLHFVR